MTTPEAVAHFVSSSMPELQVTGAPYALGGGLINYVWRVPAAPNPVVVKYAPPYIASAPSIPLDNSRIHFEAHALELLGPGGMLGKLPSDRIRPPHLLYRDDNAHALILEDIGIELPLQQAMEHSTAELREAGGQLGLFIGRLHSQTIASQVLELTFNNVSVQQTRKTVQYDTVGSLCQQLGISDYETLGEQARSLGERLLQPGACLVMGDLWPPSIWITPSGMRLIDWEFTHFGSPMQDIGHLAAHLWMIQHVNPTYRTSLIHFWKAFCQEYRGALSSYYDYLWHPLVYRDSSIHFGAELLVRIVGAFSEGSYFERIPASDHVVQSALHLAHERLRTSTRISALEQLVIPLE